MLDNLLKGINLADYEGVNELIVSIEDLKTLRREVIVLKALNEDKEQKIGSLTAQLAEVVNKQETRRLDEYV